LFRTLLLSAGALCLFAAAPEPASAQSTLREFGRGPMAPIEGMMTQAQARRACTRELRTTSRRGIPRAMMQTCMDTKMRGR
jgi:hypothetical protein